MGWFTLVTHGLSQQIVIDVVKNLCIVDEHKNHAQALSICPLYQTSYVGYGCKLCSFFDNQPVCWIYPPSDRPEFFL